MAKEKVYKLAQEFKVSSEALVQMLRGMGIVVKSHMSTVDENLRDEIKKKFESERAEIKKEYERKKQLIIKAKEDLLADEVAAAAKKIPAAPVVQAKTNTVSAQAQPTRSDAHSTPTTSFQPPRREHALSPAAHASPLQQQRDPRRTFDNRPDYRPQQTPSFGNRPAPAQGFSPTAAPVPAKPAASTFDKKNKKKGGKKKFERPEVNEVELRANIKKTLAKIGSGAARKKYKKDERTETDDTEGKKELNVSEFVTAAELANMMDVSSSQVITKCLELGLFVTINQRLDFETIEIVSSEFGFAARLMEEYGGEIEEVAAEDTNTEDLVPRSPVVTVMGHVDHGKTSLLDYIRKTNVMSGEAGGITQHIAAYRVKTKQGQVTFLDTPGHEAFTAMRARGSQITDVIVLVVAADSGVMPQTKEAIDHARAAKVPIVVAINKTDLATANIEKVKNELSQYNILVTDWGGEVSCVNISAKTGAGIDNLLETLALETELLDLKATPKGYAQGVIVEAELDKGKGSIATVLVQKGTLRKGDAFITGIHHGRVRDLFNERGLQVESAGPSDPVVVLGLSGTPQAGDSFRVVADEKEAREVSARRRLAQKERELRRIGSVSLDHLYEQIQAGRVKSLNLIIKGDVDGSVEAIATSLEKLSNSEIKVNVIHKSVGAITESDVMLATASNAIIIGFHLSPNSKIRELAHEEGVDIRTFRIIYEIIDAIKNAMEGMLAPEIKETIVGEVEVRQVFKISKFGTVAGCYVTSGTVTRNAKARLIRNDVEVIDTTISSLKRVKDDVREVATGHDCGITLDKFSDYIEGDRIEVYEEVKIARKLESAK